MFHYSYIHSCIPIHSNLHFSCAKVQKCFKLAVSVVGLSIVIQDGKKKVLLKLLDQKTWEYKLIKVSNFKA